MFLTNSVLVRLCGAAQTSTSTSLTVDRRNRLAERRLNTTVLARCLRRRVAACRSIRLPVLLSRIGPTAQLSIARSIARPTAGGSGISLSMVLAMTNRILVIGATGHLGSRTAERATAAGWSAVGTYFSSPLEAACEQLDVRDPAAVREVIERVRPDVVIHTAADRDDWRVMADGAAHVAVATAAVGVRLVHVSSDAVFSGKEIEYDESALPDPVYRYGAAKAAAETAVRAVHPGAAVVRTSLILGDGRGRHEALTRDLISGRVRGALFTDMIRKPVHVDDLAGALLELATSDYRGILNVTGPDVINRYDLGVLIARREGLDPHRIPAGRIAGSGMSLPTNVRLRTDKAASLLSIRLRGVHEFMAATAGQAPAGHP